MMESSSDKEWATKYLMDPLTEPQPSEETGPGAHFGSVNGNSNKATAVSISSYPTPPSSASPNRSSFHPSNPFAQYHRQEAFSDYAPQKRSSMGSEMAGKSGSLRRGSSLSERFPGDRSHRPLDIIRKEAKAADRSPHLKKKHMPGADTIDTLDDSAKIAWHHEGPYDATLLARNTSYKNSPVEAVRGSNEEAIKATPKENIRDALDKHVPLQGTAVIPPGMRGLDGRIMQYEEGADLMREPDAAGGPYRRWEGVKGLDYHPDDLKGKGEPSFTIERALKGHQDRNHSFKRYPQADYDEYEMQIRPKHTTRIRSHSGNDADLKSRATGTAGGLSSYADFANSMQRSNTVGRKSSMSGLKRRFGSLRLKKKVDV